MSGNDPVRTALRGRRNFKLIKLSWDENAAPVRLEILSDFDEMMQSTRAQAYCENPGEGYPAITDDALINHQVNAYILWYALRDPKKPIPDTNPEEFERIYDSALELQKHFDADQVEWIIAQYLDFRRSCSPFSTALKEGPEKFEKFLEDVRENYSKTSELALEFSIKYAARHAMLPTEARFQMMTEDQWLLMMAHLPESERMTYFPNDLPDELRPLMTSWVDGK